MIQNIPKTMWKQHIDSKVNIEETKGNHYSIFSNGIFTEEVGDRIDMYLLTNVLGERSE